MASVIFQTKLDNNLIVLLPQPISDTLPSRGTVMTRGTVNNVELWAPLEPNGEGCHWFRVPPELAKAGETIAIALEPTKIWPEPQVPRVIIDVLKTDQEAREHWDSITPMARWEWIRWMDSVKQEETRRVRPLKLCSMLKAGKRRPCCFNRALMTPPKLVISV